MRMGQGTGEGTAKLAINLDCRSCHGRVLGFIARTSYVWRTRVLQSQHARQTGPGRVARVATARSRVLLQPCLALVESFGLTATHAPR